MAKLKFRNGINGTLVDWTPDATLYNVGSIKRRIESKNPGEAGIIVFDKLGLTLGYEAGDNPVYNAFSGNLSAVQRYIFELHGIKTDKSESKLFEGLADFSTLEWPDLEKKVSFNVVDKLSAISILQAVAARESRSLKTQYPPWLTPLNYAAGEYYQINIGNTPDVNIEIIKWTGSPLTAQHVATTTIPVFEAGEILRTFDGTTEKLLFATGRYFYPGNYPGEDDTWLEAATDSDNLVGGYRIDNSDGDAYLISNPSVKLRYYKDEFYGGEITIQTSAYDGGILKQRVTSFNAQKIIKLIYNQAWPSHTVTNRSASFSISYEYWRGTINENPFGVHPLDAIKMLAGSIQSYVFVDRNGALIIQKKSDIENNTVRTFTPAAKKSGGKKKYFWDKLADAVTVTVKSGKLVDGVEVIGTWTVKKYPGIQPRNEIKLEIIAPSGVDFTVEALNAYAAVIAGEVMNFYGYRHYSFNLSTRLTDDMYDWDLLDLIDVNGERYFILSSDLNETNSSATFELVSVTGYDYDFQQARAILSTEKYNSTFTSSSSSSSGTGTIIPITAQQPLSMVGAIVTLNYTDNFKLSLDNKLETIQDIKKTSTTIEFAQIGFGGAPDTSYKVKNYGDEWIVGNQKIDGVQSIGGAADVNFKQKIYGNQKITGNITVDGDIYIGGSINRVNVVDLDISDHAIRLNKGGDNTTALDGGMEMLGTGDSVLGSIKYNGTNWLSDLSFDIANGKTYKINNVDVLSATTLGTSVVTSSLTSVGTLNHDLNIANTKVYKINSTEVLSSTSLGSTVVSSSLTSIGTLNHDLNIASTKVYRINGTQILSSTGLGSTVVSSSLTGVGTLTTGVWNATAINGQYINYNTTNLKVTTNQLNTIQDISTTSSPTFANITLSGRIDQQGTTNSEFGSQSVLPKQSYYGNLGALNKKWLTLHAAELWVETLVAQDTIATIGGRVLVGPTTSLTQDLLSTATTIYVKHNQMVSGDVVYMEAQGKIEFLRITSSASGSAGNYSYSVTRDLDATGANDWYAGDAMFNTGQAGNGFIDLYSIRGIKSASQTGPTIVGNVRNSATYNDWSEHWAIGNLNNLYGYATNIYGVGLGKYAAASVNITADPTNGFRIRNYTTTLAQWDNTGKIILGTTATESCRIELASGAINFIYKEDTGDDLIKIGMDSGGNASFTGSITATSGTIGGVSFNHEWLYMGTLANPTIVINNTQKSIYVRPLGTGTNTKFVMVGQTHDGTNWTGYYGISAVDGNNNMLFRIDNAVKSIAGFNFDPTKIFLGSSTAGFALNTSSTPFITGINAKGFEVYDVSNPKMFLGLRDGSGNLSAGFDWNITTTNKMTMKGEFLASKFSTTNTFDYSNDSGIFIEGDYVRATAPASNVMNNAIFSSSYLQFSTVGVSTRSLLIASSTAGSLITINDKNVPKFWGVLDTMPTDDLRAGDYCITSNSVLCIYNGSTWKYYNQN